MQCCQLTRTQREGTLEPTCATIAWKVDSSSPGRVTGETCHCWGNCKERHDDEAD